MSDGTDHLQAPPQPTAPDRTPVPIERNPETRVNPKNPRPRMMPVWILTGAAVVAGIAWAVTDRLWGEPSAVVGPVPIVTAEVEPYKVRPDDPGGLEVPNRDKLIYETLTDSEPVEAPEQLLPPPEEPVAPPEPAAISEEVVSAEDPPETERSVETSQVEAAPPVQVMVEPIADVPEDAEEPEALLMADEEPAEQQAEPVQEPELETTADEAEIFMTSTNTEPEAITPAEDPPAPSAEPTVDDAVTAPSEAEASAPPEQDAVAETEQPAEPVPTPAPKPLVVAEAEPPAPVEPDPAEPPTTAEPALAEEPTTVARADTESPAPAAADSPFLIQLGAVPVRASAARQWEQLRGSHEDILGALGPVIVQADLGDKGIWYRLRAGPFADRATAVATCERLKARDLGCFVVAN